MKLKMPKLKMPKMNRAKLDISNVNIRKFNWTTVFAIIAYLNIFAIPVFIASKDKSFVRFHAKQGLILFAYFAVVTFALYIPLVPWIFYAFYLFGIIWGIVSIVLGRERPIPFIGKLAERI